MAPAKKRDLLNFETCQEESVRELVAEMERQAALLSGRPLKAACRDLVVRWGCGFKEFQGTLWTSITELTDGRKLTYKLHEAAPWRLAFLIFASGHPRSFERLLTSIWRPHHTYLMHVDPKSPYRQALLSEGCRARRNCYAIAEVPIVRGGSGFLLATLRAASLLISKDFDWQHFIILSEADYPMRSVESLEDFLAVAGPRSFVGVDPDSTYSVGRLRNGSHAALQCGSRTFVFSSRGPGVKEVLRPEALYGAGPHLSGPQWMVLSRTLLQRLMQDVQVDDSLVSVVLSRVARFAQPDEAFFQTLLAHPNFTLRHLLDPMALTWHAGPPPGQERMPVRSDRDGTSIYAPQSPPLATMDDLPFLMRSITFFARKFNAGSTAPLQDALDAQMSHGRGEGHDLWEDLPSNVGLWICGGLVEGPQIKLQRRRIEPSAAHPLQHLRCSQPDDVFTELRETAGAAISWADTEFKPLFAMVSNGWATISQTGFGVTSGNPVLHMRIGCGWQNSQGDFTLPANIFASQWAACMDHGLVAVVYLRPHAQMTELDATFILSQGDDDALAFHIQIPSTVWKYAFPLSVGVENLTRGLWSASLYEGHLSTPPVLGALASRKILALGIDDDFLDSGQVNLPPFSQTFFIVVDEPDFTEKEARKIQTRDFNQWWCEALSKRAREAFGGPFLGEEIPDCM